jgi:hypothetical protein
VGPEGKLTTQDRRDPYGATKYECDTDRMRLASTNHERFFREMMDDANRANASFYPIDPRGLAVFDNPIGPAPPPPPAIDQAMLRTRIEAMRTLAENTDGMTVVNNNNLDASLRRIADDLTSYYLLGYYSTNSKLDGGFRRIAVRVKRPGVNVRARRGYRAATAGEVAAARASTEGPAPTASSALSAALSSLGRIRPDARFRINASGLTGSPGTLWVAGELLPTSTAGDLEMGGVVDIEASAGSASTTARVALERGQRAFVASLRVPGDGTQSLQVRARVSSEALTVPLTDAVDVDAVRDIGQPLVFRRGPSTGNRTNPSADFRFTRNERLRLEIPIAAGVTEGEGRLLDTAGQPLQIPVKVGNRVDDGTGQRWITADLVLAALAPGDYAVEVGATKGAETERILTAIRIVR